MAPGRLQKNSRDCSNNRSPNLQLANDKEWINLFISHE
jgi:hypothetical protein